jgi:hypothetical protein
MQAALDWYNEAMSREHNSFVADKNACLQDFGRAQKRVDDEAASGRVAWNDYQLRTQQSATNLRRDLATLEDVYGTIFDELYQKFQEEESRLMNDYCDSLEETGTD